MLIGKMGLIYSHATLTVIAAAGDNPNYGLPGVGTTKRRHRTTVQIDFKTFAISRGVQREIAASKWNSRGWTYQEALLSRRRLVFTDSRFYFQCCAMHCPESLAFPLQSLHISNAQRFPEKLTLWKAFPARGVGNGHHSPMDRIVEFMNRNLSFDADALRAFQGIIEEFKNSKSQVHFLSGVPLAPREYVIGPGLDNAWNTSQLVFGLTWGDIKYSRLKRKFSRRIGFPSWSWLGWKVEMDEIGEADWGPKMELFGLEYKWSPIGTRRYGTFQNHLEVMVDLPDSTVIPWKGNRELIQSKFSNGEIPRYLPIDDWTCGLEIKRSTVQDDWEVSWPDYATQNMNNDHWPLQNCCDINLSYLMAGQLSATLSLLILCSTAHKPHYKVCLPLKHSDHIKAYERIGICNLLTFCHYSGMRMVDPKAPIEELLQTHSTFGPLQFAISEARLG
ncbi:hypothetical protein EJ08DRAFT_327446 [Tothia fuscella]|uniref:Heterokaryon incompatibility domain-containing protein n=1 Tax=Tothia fuscella TaxID=1048955 RepID=A0A9P4NMA8_9PEZI|nr:hypothetical protein EJ08DRAFT_327446 [Tothia fuscella]